ncbi:MAG TPA: GNAT family N-acetyltransferase [Dehalococcoidia bacterium]|nr:GNAT family N-acetyltransferase [Dehalococcoidia bacterium]
MTKTDIEGEIAHGDRVVLRSKRREDAEADYSWRKDPELVPYDAVKPISATFGDFLALYEDDLNHPTPFRRTFALDDMEGRHIGNVMFYNIDLLKREAEIGITIGDRDYWNRGYGADALRALVRYIFTDTALTRIYLKTLDWNVRAQYSFKKAGFVQYGTSRRSNGTFILMEMRRNDWEARERGDVGLRQM